MQRAPTSCSPPHRVAANCATQRAARAQPSAAGKPQSAFPPEEQAQPNAKPSSLPRVRLTAAPLSLRRVLPSPAAILAGLALRQPAEYALYAGGRRSSARGSSFDPPKTVLFVNKENQKNFRRMLTHPKATGGPILCSRAGPTSRGRAKLRFAMATSTPHP